MIGVVAGVLDGLARVVVAISPFDVLNWLGLLAFALVGALDGTCRFANDARGPRRVVGA